MNSKSLGPACYRFKIWMNLSSTSFSTAHSNQHYCCSSPQLSPKGSQCVHPCHSQLRTLSLKCKTDLKHPGAFNASCNVLYSRFPSAPASFWSMANPQLSGFESLVAEDCIFWVVSRCLSGTGPGEGVHLIQAELTLHWGQRPGHLGGSWRHRSRSVFFSLLALQRDSPVLFTRRHWLKS